MSDERRLELYEAVEKQYLKIPPVKPVEFQNREEYCPQDATDAVEFQSTALRLNNRQDFEAPPTLSGASGIVAAKYVG